MLRQVLLEIPWENEFQATRTEGVTLRVVECKAFNAKGMALFMELRGPHDSSLKTVSRIRELAGIRQVIVGSASEEITPILVIAENPPVCSASRDEAIICLQCPYNSDAAPVTWLFLVNKASDLRHVMANLERGGITPGVREIAPLTNDRDSLTHRQREVMELAIAKGYFEFPRRTNLSELAELIGVSPAGVSEVLRSAERKLMHKASMPTMP